MGCNLTGSDLALAWRGPSRTPSLLARDGDVLFGQYRHALEALGNGEGTLALILNKSGAARWSSSWQRYEYWRRLASGSA